MKPFTKIIFTMIFFSGYISNCQINYDFKNFKNSSLLIIDQDTMNYDYEKDTGNKNDYTFIDGIVKFKNDSIAYYKGSKLYSKDKEFKFIKPWLSKKTKVKELTTNVELLKYSTDYDTNKVTLFHLNSNESLLKSSDMEVVKVWSEFRQGFYVFYNCPRSKSFLPETIGTIAALAFIGI